MTDPPPKGSIKFLCCCAAYKYLAFHCYQFAVWGILHEAVRLRSAWDQSHGSVGGVVRGDRPDRHSAAHGQRLCCRPCRTFESKG
eukprot:6202176-Pleurochrysis_carterae.AAC.4